MCQTKAAELGGYLIRRLNKSRLSEDSAQKATGKKTLSGSEPEAGVCKLSAIRTP